MSADLALALMFTYTRSSWIGASIAILVLGLVYDWRVPAIVGAAVVGLLVLFPHNPVSQRAFTMTSKFTTSNVERKYMWDSGWKMIKDRPWQGYGVDNLSRHYPAYRHPESIEKHPPHVHDTVMQLAINGGIGAALCYLWWVAAMLWTGYRSWWFYRKVSPARAGAVLGLTAALLAFFVNGWLEFNFGASQVIAIVYFLTGLLAVYARPVRNSRVSVASAKLWELPEKPRILFIRPRFRGDVLMASILPRLIKRDYPKAWVDILTEPEAADTAAGEPEWNTILSLPRRDGKAWWRTVRRIRRQHYDVVCDLFGNPRTALLTGLSGAGIKIGPQVRVWDILYDIQTQADQPGKRPAWESYLDILRAVGMKQLSLRPHWEPRDEDRDWVQAFLQERQLKSAALLGVFAGGSHQAKRWPLENFMEVARRLHKEFGMKAMFVFGPKEEELKQQYQQAGGKLTQAVEGLTPGQLAALWDHCSVVLANDAFPLHLGPAVGTPTIGLFGPGDPAVWFPYPAQNGHRALHQPPVCWPCHKDTCSRPECWEKITVDDVVAAVKAAIKAK
jgi:ADP-heptose:LPS heptosyltransferase